MISLKATFSCILLIAGAWTCVHSWTGEVIGDLPGEVIADILTILIFGVVDATGNCSDAKNATEVEYWLYTRNNPNDSIVVHSFDQIDASKPVIFLIHGWGGNANIDYIRVIKDAYLKRYDCNIISVDYSEYAASNYQTGYCHVPGVGENVADFICNMSTALNISLSDLHVVGHSLGGQTAGLAGKSTQKTCGKLGRITALDPAGPLYQGVNKKFRLDQSDAQLVDVIHTNQGEFGYIGNCGDVDFYPNCGYLQKGCVEVLLNETSSIEDIIKFPLDYIRCNHQRSCYLFAESINNNGFYSTNCWNCGTIACIKALFPTSHVYMGESVRTKPKDDAYVLKTNDKPPYALGPEGPLD